MKFKREPLHQCVLHFAGLTVFSLFTVLLLFVTALAKSGLPLAWYLIGALCAVAVFTGVSAVVITLVLLSRRLCLQFPVQSKVLVSDDGR